MACMKGGGKKALKNRFIQNLHQHITVRTQCDKDGTKMKIKVSQHKFNIHYQGSPEEVELTFPKKTKSHLGKKQPQAKIPKAFLFSQLHFNNVISDALFHGGNLVMRSKKCAMNNQRLTSV